MADTNPRDLLRRLADEFEGWIVHAEAEDIKRAHNLVDEARAYLNQPKPKSKINWSQLLRFDFIGWRDNFHHGRIRRAVARWGK